MCHELKGAFAPSAPSLRIIDQSPDFCKQLVCYDPRALWKRTWECPLIEFLPGHECVAIHDADNGVTCSIIGRDGASRPISADYLVACDGASSFVRRFIGARAEGRILQHMIGVYFTTDLSELIEHRKSILYWTLNPNAFGVLIAHWLPDEWVLFVPYFPPQQSAAEFSKERCRALVNAAIGASTFDINIRTCSALDGCCKSCFALSARTHFSRRGRCA